MDLIKLTNTSVMTNSNGNTWLEVTEGSMEVQVAILKHNELDIDHYKKTTYIFAIHVIVII